MKKSMKKIIIVLITILFLTSCTNNKDNLQEQSKEDSDNTIDVTLKINMPLNYDDLDNIFIFPMTDYLEENNIGEIIGDGSPIDEYGPYATDIELIVNENKIDDFKEMVLEYVYPKGSYLEIDGKTDIEFGDLLGIRLIFYNLDEEQIENIYNDLEQELSSLYKYKTIYNINNLTTVYFYGNEIIEIKKEINEYITKNNLKENIEMMDMDIEIK